MGTVKQLRPHFSMERTDATAGMRARPASPVCAAVPVPETSKFIGLLRKRYGEFLFETLAELQEREMQVVEMLRNSGVVNLQTIVEVFELFYLASHGCVLVVYPQTDKHTQHKDILALAITRHDILDMRLLRITADGVCLELLSEGSTVKHLFVPFERVVADPKRVIVGLLNESNRIREWCSEGKSVGDYAEYLPAGFYMRNGTSLV